jgi:hypothetical protein
MGSKSSKSDSTAEQSEVKLQGKPEQASHTRVETQKSIFRPSDGTCLILILVMYDVINAIDDLESGLILPDEDRLRSSFDPAELEALEICTESPLTKASFISLIAPPSEPSQEGIVDEWERFAVHLFNLAVVGLVLQR